MADELDRASEYEEIARAAALRTTLALIAAAGSRARHCEHCEENPPSPGSRNCRRCDLELASEALHAERVESHQQPQAKEKQLRQRPRSNRRVQSKSCGARQIDTAE